MLSPSETAELNELLPQRSELERLARIASQTNFGSVGTQCASVDLSRLEALLAKQQGGGLLVPATTPFDLPPLTFAGHS